MAVTFATNTRVRTRARHGSYIMRMMISPGAKDFGPSGPFSRAAPEPSLFQLSSEASEGITGRVHRTREGTETECGLCSNFLAVIANHEKHSPKKRVWCLSSLGISLMTRSYL
jgi:hypothetical protein